jgi:hypothetical protein
MAARYSNESSMVWRSAGHDLNIVFSTGRPRSFMHFMARSLHCRRMKVLDLYEWYLKI